MKLLAAIFKADVTAVQIERVFQSTILKRSRMGFPLVRNEQLLALIKGRFKMLKNSCWHCMPTFLPCSTAKCPFMKVWFLGMYALKKCR